MTWAFIQFLIKIVFINCVCNKMMEKNKIPEFVDFSNVCQYDHGLTTMDNLYYSVKIEIQETLNVSR